MKFQILFSRKNQTNISKCYLLKFLTSMQNVNVDLIEISEFDSFYTLKTVECNAISQINLYHPLGRFSR